MPNKMSTRQQGSALIVMVFAIVVFFSLAAILININSRSQQSVSYEMLGTKALWAARSGMEHTIQKILPIGQAAALCADGSTTVVDFSMIDGNLQQCTASISCVSNFVSNDGMQHAEMQSTGTCVAGDFRSQRVIKVEVKI
jgi:MSHA biogenesis protein MshP